MPAPFREGPRRLLKHAQCLQAVHMLICSDGGAWLHRLPEGCSLLHQQPHRLAKLAKLHQQKPAMPCPGSMGPASPPTSR